MSPVGEDLIENYGVDPARVQAHEQNNTIEEFKLFVLSEGLDNAYPEPKLPGS